MFSKTATVIIERIQIYHTQQTIQLASAHFLRGRMVYRLIQK